MTNLFIIGNGFDLSHNLPTHYGNFREYLRTTYSYKFDEEPTRLANVTMDPSGKWIYDDESVHYLDSLISLASDYETWADFESSLGCLDYSIVDEYIQISLDRDGDEDNWHTTANYEDTYSELINIVGQIKVLFKKWICSIPISHHSYHYPLNTVQSFQNIINPEEDIFLNFNYTTTLEYLYQVQNITHIHGCRDKNEELIIGHNNTTEYEEEPYQQDIYKNRMCNSLRKNVELCIKNNEVFFEMLKESDIDNIFSYGFSFADVDLEYIQKIISLIDTNNTTWFFESYPGKKELTNYHNKLIKIEFNGTFDLF